MRSKDVCLPIWILLFGIFLLFAAVICAVLAFSKGYGLFVGTAVGLVLGIAAILSWKNQWIEMTGSTSFVYSTMFGNQKTYSFSEIIDIKQNPDSVDLIMEDGKVHIESAAKISQRFAEALDARLRIINV